MNRNSLHREAIKYVVYTMWQCSKIWQNSTGKRLAVCRHGKHVSSHHLLSLQTSRFYSQDVPIDVLHEK